LDFRFLIFDLRLVETTAVALPSLRIEKLAIKNLKSKILDFRFLIFDLRLVETIAVALPSLRIEKLAIKNLKSKISLPATTP
jgi:hypothetical protein